MCVGAATRVVWVPEECGGYTAASMLCVESSLQLPRDTSCHGQVEDAACALILLLLSSGQFDVGWYEPQYRVCVCGRAGVPRPTAWS